MKSTAYSLIYILIEAAIGVAERDPYIGPFYGLHPYSELIANTLRSNSQAQSVWLHIYKSLLIIRLTGETVDQAPS